MPTHRSSKQLHSRAITRNNSTTPWQSGGKSLGRSNGGVSKGNGTVDRSKITCYLCDNVGHFKSEYPEAKMAPSLATTVSDEVIPGGNRVTNYNLCKPCIFPGKMSVVQDRPGVPVKVLRDTAATCSVVLRIAVPGVEHALTSEHVLINVVGGKEVDSVPLAKLYLESGLLSRTALVAVDVTLPVKRVDFLLGNEIVGNLVVPDPIISITPLDTDVIDCVEGDNDYIFPVCAVTRNQARLSVAVKINTV